MTSNLPSPTIIASPSALRELVRRLQNEPLIAIDTESNSLYAYREKVCLVQISTRDHDWLVDPLAVRDLSPLGPLFADPDIENVFHASEYDIMCMKRDYDFKFNNLFDTMFAARILGLKSFGLGSLLEAYFDVQVDKRYQRADWSQRPIPAELLQYAQMDTHYLPALRDILRDQLMDQDRLIEAKEVFDLLTEVPASAHTTDPEGFWRIHLARDFSRKQFAILRELYILRETLAEQRDRPPFKVFTDQVLVAITLAEPHTLKELGAVPGMSHGQLDRFGARILNAIKLGEVAPPPSRPDRNPRLDPITLARYDALHDWRKARATERGVESDVILPKEALWALAKTAPQSVDDLVNIPGLGPWKREKYGSELVNLLAGVASGD